MLDKHTKGERFMKKTKGMLLCATLLLGATYVPVAGAIADGVTPSVDARQGEGEVDPLDPTQPVDPTPVDPTPVDPTPVDPTPVDPTPVDPTPVDPTPVDPTPVDPTPVDPTPVDPTPVDPTPVDPTPVDPTPVDPTPVDPTPVDPTPVDPTPVKPTPVDPTPVKPTPVNFDLDKGSVTTQTGQTIIGTEDSKPIIQLADGTVKKVEPKEVGATVQKDGTVKVKGKDGKMNVLPHTGSENNIFLSLLGGVTTLITGGIAFILKRKLG